ncbi:MAG TPA: SIS domain-containing protein [Phototrophicaceae bacterium]|nr:SIS domain-containing protein [Phototrophicaceae bacterium]
MTSLLHSEISEQPSVLANLLQQERANVERIAQAIRNRQPRYLVLAARGSSDNAARYSQYLFGTVNHLTAALATPSLFTLYQQPPRMDDALVIAISQSGQSPDIVSVVAEGKRQGALTIAITNAPDAPLAQTADHTILLHAGAEKAVAATKTYSTSLMALAMLSAALAQDQSRFETLARVPDWIDQVIQNGDKTIAAAERYCYINYCVVASRGYNYATAYEIALKLKELTYIIAEPYSSADFQHGPVAVVEHGFPVFAVVPEGILGGELVGFFKQLRDKEADLVVVSAEPDALALAQTRLSLPAGIPEWASPLVAVVQGQLFALGLTLAKGYNPDQPRGLHKVTLTK